LQLQLLKLDRVADDHGRDASGLRWMRMRSIAFKDVKLKENGRV